MLTSPLTDLAFNLSVSIFCVTSFPWVAVCVEVATGAILVVVSFSASPKKMRMQRCQMPASPLYTYVYIEARRGGQHAIRMSHGLTLSVGVYGIGGEEVRETEDTAKGIELFGIG